MSGQESVLPTYQSVPDSALESLIEKETKQEYGASTTVADDGNGIFSKKNKIKAGTVFVLALVIAIFTLRAGFFGKKAQEYNTVGVSPDGFPANSVQGVIANNEIGTIISEQQEEVTTDVDASYIDVIEVPSEPAATVVESSEEVVEEEEEEAVEQAEEETTVAEEESVEEETSEEEVVEVAVSEPVYEPVSIPDPTGYPVPPPTAAPTPGKAQPTKPTATPTAAMQITAAQLKRMRSDSRLSPLSMSMYTDANNWIKTFFSKYGLVGTRFTNKQSYKAPDPIIGSTVEGSAASWMYATIYSDPSCGVDSGTMYSIAGIANNECIPIAGFGGEKGVAFMMDCRTNGDVVMNAYNANDCGGAPISSTILALSATCYAYSYSLSDTVTDTTSTTSVVFSCGQPNLEGMAVSKFFVGAYETATFNQCEASSKELTDGQVFEAYPAPLCIPQVQSDGNSFSVTFSHNAETNAPYVTFYKGSIDCVLKTTAATASSGTLDLGYSCIQQTNWATTETMLSVYNRWSYHDSSSPVEEVNYASGLDVDTSTYAATA